MKKGYLAGWKTVFSFTFGQHVRSRGYSTATVLVAVLLAVLIPAGMLLADALISDMGDAQPRTETALTGAVIVNETGAEMDWGIWQDGEGPYAALSLRQSASVEEAAATIAETEVILLFSGGADGMEIRALRPEESIAQEEDALGCAEYAAGLVQTALVMGAHADAAALQAALAPTGIVIEAQEEEQGHPAGLAGELIEILLPYVVLMVTYFMVLAYGQSVASSVVMEKTSKLMDLFLVSVQPGALLLGKLLGIALAAMLQLTAWVAGAAAGIGLGLSLVKMVNPDSTLGLIVFFEYVGELGAAFQPAGVMMGVLMAACGFLLYCSLSAFGGALAGKPEDLSGTNMFFTIILIASFFAVIYTGAPESGMITDAAWSVWIPFVAIMVVPGRLMLGQISLAQGALSLGLVLLTALAITLLAGKVYALCAFYKGDPIKPTQLAKLFAKSK